jgi:phosphate transport system permease protein
MAEVVFGETHYTVLFLIGAILFLFTFILNAFAEIFVRKRLLRRFGGG